jgi:class 3 adenylate cyclase
MYRLSFSFIMLVTCLSVSSAQPVPDPESRPVLTRVIINYDSVLLPSIFKEDNEIVFTGKIILSQHENNIEFELQFGDTIEYRYFLQGFDKDWIPWQKKNIKEYTNLPSGRYLFKVKSLLPGNVAKQMKPVSFRVLPHWYLSWPSLFIYIVLVILLIWSFYDQLNFRFARKQYMLEQIINERTEDLIQEKEKTEALLSNVLPKNTADEIIAKGKATKIKYNFVTVLFSDIQGFTRIAEEMNPEVLIDELDKFFFHFDTVVEKYGIEKIKTIGDAYMCAGGIPEKNRTNPVEVILAALEMQQYMNRLKATPELEGMKYWDIRIGIHTGTVVAGVVGQKKLSYDIWGDTVNTASRMESSGEAGKINISGTTYEFVKEFFICEHRGKMPVKYKGDLDMYFVDGIVDDLRDENNGPNNKFVVKMHLIKLQDIEEYIIKLYDDEAPPDLYFHNSLLLRNISNQVELLSNAERLPDEEFIHLRLGSVFLLTGFISNYDKPMEASCQLVDEILPKYGFDQENIDRTKTIIINSFSEKQESLSDNILHDARYDYLGRIDYIKLTDKRLKEETEYGEVKDSNLWIQLQRKLLTEHEFITPTARLLRSVSIEDQVSALQAYGREIK